MFRKVNSILLIYLLCFFINKAIANDYKVDDINIKGERALSKNQIFSMLEIKTGNVSKEKISSNIKLLYNSGFFKNIVATIDNNILIFEVEERPIISDIKIQGNSAIKNKDILKWLNSIGIKKFNIMKLASLEEIKVQIEQLYDIQGRYGTQVDIEQEQISDTSVNLIIKISEIDISKIRKIRFVGNNFYSDNELFDNMSLQNPGIWGEKKYNKYILSNDIKQIKALYLNNGFLKYELLSLETKISPDKKQIYLNFNLYEGDRYKINNVNILGNYPLNKNLLEKIKKNQYYSQALIEEKIRKIKNNLADIGYLSVNVDTDLIIDDENNQVIVNLIVNPNSKYYIRNITFSGNIVTKDDVLRRELRQMPNSLASEILIKLSKQRINRLGYFKSVKVERKPVVDTNNQIDLNFIVEERSRASLNGQIAYSNLFKTSFGLNYQHKNILGTGKDFAINTNLNSARQNVSVSLLDPFFTKYDLNAKYSLFYNNTDFDEVDLTSFGINNRGLNIDIGYPISESQNISYGINARQSNIRVGKDAPLEISKYIESEGNKKKFFDFSINITHSINTLDFGFLPTEGYLQNLSLEVSTPLGDTSFYDVSFNNSIYYPLFENKPIILNLTNNINYGEPFGDSKFFPFYRYRSMGGISTLRGYATSSIGPRETQLATNDIGQITSYNTLGGNISFNSLFEIKLNFSSLRKSGVLPLLFYDIANVYNNNCIIINSTCNNKVNFSKVKQSYGVAISWFSPIGPMSFSYGIPINPADDDIIDNFQFALGFAF